MSNTETATYLVKGISIRHGGKTYPPGRKIELADDDAKRLRDFLEPLAGEKAVQGGAELLGCIEENGRLTARIENLNAQLASRESDLDELTIELAQVRNTNTTLNAQLAERDSTIATLNAQITALKKAAEKGGKK